MLSYTVIAGTPRPVACDGSGGAGRIEAGLGLEGGGGQGPEASVVWERCWREEVHKVFENWKFLEIIYKTNKLSE